MTRQHFDVLVIGSGPNGLAAAITLAEHGRSVLVLEARSLPGGAVATEELTLPGFHHDTYSSVYPAGAASPVFARMPLERHGLRWIHPPVAMAHPLPEGRAAALYRDLERTVVNLETLAPGDGQRWRTLVTPYLKHFTAVRKTLFSGFPPVEGGARMLATLGVSGVLGFARLFLLPASNLADELFHSQGGRAWLYGSALHGDVPLEEAGSAITALYLNLLGHAVGWPSPQGGAGNLAAALVRYLRHLGGLLRTETPVERVLTAHHRVTGVRTVGGEELYADSIIANVTPHGLLRLAGDALPSWYRRALERYRYGAPTLKLDWALSAPIPWDAPEARQAGTVHVGGDGEAVQHAQAQQRAGLLPDAPFMLLGQQSVADPTRAPQGQHTAWAYTHPPAGVDWKAETERWVELMEAHIEQYAPGFRQRILARHVITPPDFERRNRNLVQGDVGGGSYALHQLVFRPLPALAPYQTPIRGLYIGSAATFPGGAVHGVGGDAAARLALLETRLPRFW
jgi:phytoene dehydrogenase-like protein